MTSKPMYCQLTKTGADIFQKVFKEIDMTLQWELNIGIRSYMGVSNNGIPKSSIVDRVFNCKPSILGYPHFWKHPYILAIWVC